MLENSVGSISVVSIKGMAFISVWTTKSPEVASVLPFETLLLVFLCESGSLHKLPWD